MFTALFLPAFGIIKKLSLLELKDANNLKSDGKIKELFHVHTGIYSVFDKLKSFLLFISPILTVFFAQGATK